MTTFTVAVTLFVDNAWLDITEIDDDTKVISEVTITRGRSDEQSQVSPTTVTFTYLDNNATLDGENPLSAYYRKIGVGTPLRVTVGGEERAVVEVVSWEPVWERNADGVDVTTVAVEAAGILRRIDAGRKPLNSPAYRAITSVENSSERVAYWPLEEESDATDVFSPDGNAPPGIAGTIDFGSYTESLSSARMLTFSSSDALLFFTVPEYTSSEHKVVSLWTMPDPSLSANTALMRLYCSGGNVDFIDLEYGATLDGSLRLNAYRAGSLLDSSNFANYSPYIVNQHFLLTLEFTQDGSDLDTRLTVVNMDPSISGTETLDTFTGVTLGRVAFITVAQQNCEGAAFGHLIVGNTTAAFGNYIDIDPVDGSYGARGYLNESIDRINRLAAEEAIPITIVGDTATGRLAPQSLDTVMDLIRKAADANMGILYEDRNSLSLEFRTRLTLYNQTATPLTYAHLSPGFKPVTDDKIVNSVTAQRDGGGSAAYDIPNDDVLHWTTQDPPDGARKRDTEISPAVSEDSQLPFFAAWVAHLGSWREKRFPLVTMELARSAFDADDRAAVMALDIGDVFSIDTSDAPAYVPGNEIRLMVQGYTEVVSKFLHTLTFNTTPADRYEVEVVDANSALANVIDADDTSVKLAITDDGPPWSTTDEPYYIQINGDAMEVTTITTDTAAFIAAGAPAYADNTTVQPALPAGMTADAGQLLVVVATRRQTGAGVLGAAPAGWTEILTNGSNVKLFGRYYVTGVTAPTIAISGGSAGDTVGAVMLGFSGLSLNLDKNTYTGSYPNGFVESVNASAQNILYPAYLNRRTNSAMLLIGVKDDDWTSVATIAGTSELVDSSSLTGSDIGIVVDFYNPGAPSTVISQSFTVTGGASAVSNGLVVGLRPLQTATVVRGTNGVATSHTAGDPVRVWRSGVNAL